MLRKGMRRAAGLALGAAFCFAAVTDASAQERIRWKMHSAFAGNLAILGTAGKRIERTIKEISNGAFELRFFEPGALVPGIAYFDPVSQGSLDAGYGTPGYHVGKEPALAYFTAVPFGPGFGEFNAWLKYGGGNELLDEIYGRHNIKGMICGMIPPEASGWFRREIKSLDDMKGLKMRFFGLGAKVMEKFGVSTQLLAGGDIYPALELGTIDAAEYSMPVVDLNAGFHQVAKYYYHPGWHQQVTFHEFIVNMDRWKALSDLQRQQIQIACDANLIETFAESEAANGKALAKLKAKGAEVRTFSPEMLAKLEEAWREVLADQSAKSPEFKKVWSSFATFREEYSSWADLAYLPTGTAAARAGQ